MSEELIELCEELLTYFNFTDPDDLEGPIYISVYNEGDLVEGIADNELVEILSQIKDTINGY
jgi:uncharacterized FlaG/YvyC family protein